MRNTEIYERYVEKPSCEEVLCEARITHVVNLKGSGLTGLRRSKR